MKLQTLKQRKSELDKLLLEKNNLLQQLCREEAQLIGCYPSIDAASIESGDGVSNTLRRRVDTSFKLSENLLNNGTFGGKEDDIHKLLLGKQIQQQISEASMKMANDLAQTKVSVHIGVVFTPTFGLDSFISTEHGFNYERPIALTTNFDSNEG